MELSLLPSQLLHALNILPKFSHYSFIHMIQACTISGTYCILSNANDVAAESRQKSQMLLMVQPWARSASCPWQQLVDRRVPVNIASAHRRVVLHLECSLLPTASNESDPASKKYKCRSSRSPSGHRQGDQSDLRVQRTG